MLVRVGAEGPAVLDEQDNVKALKVVSQAGVGRERLLAALAASPAAEDDHVWIPAAVLRALAQPLDGWDDAFTAMLTKVEPFGWYDAAGDLVKAHVEHDLNL